MTEKNYHLGIKALFQDESGNILLLKVNQKKFRKPFPVGEWDLPGGRVLEGATLEETLRREVQEETGLQDFKILELLNTFLSPIEIPLKSGKKVGLILSVYHCALQGAETVALSAEHIDFKWFPLHQGLALLLNKYPKVFIDKALDLQHGSQDATLARAKAS